MPIQYPIHASGEPYQTIWDASGRAIAGGLSPEDAEEICNALNDQPKRKSKKVQAAEVLRQSDLSGQDRTDIDYMPFDQVPGGHHILRLGAAKRKG